MSQAAATGRPGEAGLATPRFRLPHLSRDSPSLPRVASVLTHILPPSLIAPFLGVIREALLRDPHVPPTSYMPP